MAPRFNRGGARGGGPRNRGGRQITDARQIIQRNQVSNTFSENQVRQYNNQQANLKRSSDLSGRLGFNANNRRSNNMGINPKFAGRIGHQKPAQKGFQTNHDQNKPTGLFGLKLSHEKKVLYLGQQLLVTSKQNARAENLSFQESPSPTRTRINPNRSHLANSSMDYLQDYLRIADRRKPIHPLVAKPLPPPPVASSINNYGLLVSNLHPSVSEQDVIELFSDVGQVSSAKLQHPGAALVIYEKREDAEKACQVYHNRLLDDQPMQCSVLALEQQRSRIASRLGGRIEPNTTHSPSHSNFSAPFFPPRGSLIPTASSGAAAMASQPRLIPVKQSTLFGQDVTFIVKLP